MDRKLREQKCDISHNRPVEFWGDYFMRIIIGNNNILHT